MDTRCGTCGARTSGRAGWCSLCLTPTGPTQRPGAGRSQQHESTAGRHRSTQPGVDLLLAELAEHERLDHPSQGRLGPFLQLRRGTRFVVALGAAALVAGVGCLLVAVVAAVVG